MPRTMIETAKVDCSIQTSGDAKGIQLINGNRLVRICLRCDDDIEFVEAFSCDANNPQDASKWEKVKGITKMWHALAWLELPTTRPTPTWMK